MPPREPDQIPYTPEEPKKNTSTGLPGHSDHVVPIRTLSSDLARAVREQGGSVVKIAMAEDEKRRREYTQSNDEPKKNRVFIFASIALILVAGATFAGIYFYNKSKVVEGPPAVVLPPSIVRAEEASALDLTDKRPDQIIASIKEVVADPKLRLSSIRNLVPVRTVAGVQQRVTASDFLTALGTRAPAEFKRALSKDYMLGVYLFDGSDLFVVLRGTARDFLLAGMLEWEEDLFDDMAPLFGVEGMAPAESEFVDALLQNRNTRAVLDTEKRPVLFYSFLDEDTIIITADQKALVEAVRRFGQ